MRIRIYRRDHFPRDQRYRNSYRDKQSAMVGKAEFLRNNYVAGLQGHYEPFAFDGATLAWVLQIDHT